MKKWSWTLLFGAVVVLLLLWSLRENFDNYEAALRDVGQSTGYTAAPRTGAGSAGGASSTSDQCKDEVATKQWEDVSDICKNSVTGTRQSSAYNGREGSRGSSGATPPPAPTNSGPEQDYIDPICPSETTRSTTDGMCYRTESEIIASCPTGYSPSSTGICHKAFGSPDDNVDPQCPTGRVNNNGYCKSPAVQPSCPAGYTQGMGVMGITCSKPRILGSTGGSSIIPESNSGGFGGSPLLNSSGGKKGNIWGPAYTGMGDNAGDGRGNSKRDYPTLIGPQPKASTMVEGAGIANVSQHRTLVTSGALPNASSTGSDPSSQFFGTSRVPGDQGSGSGTSRVPGDQDLIPNPYLEFTPSIGSSKTEPIPYLSDFSAFFH